MPQLDRDTLRELHALLQPLMGNELQRRAALHWALGDEDVLKQIDYAGAEFPFIVNLVNTLSNYGEIAPGSPALCMLLEGIRDQVGHDKRVRIDALRKKMGCPGVAPSPPEVPPAARPQDVTDFAIITALEEERDAVLAKLPGHQKVPPSEDDVRVYFRADVPVTSTDGSCSRYRAVVTNLLNMGRVNAANATGDAIRRWRPRYVLLVGIAAGVPERGARLGDVLISDQVIDYELQKLTPEGPEMRWEVHRVDPRLLAAVRGQPGDAWLHLVQEQRPQEGRPECLIGPIATGDKVVALKSTLDRYRDFWPKLIGLEMEAGGVASAAFQAATQPGFFMVRGVSDLADEAKGTAVVESWRKYACDVAAAYTLALLQSGPVPPAAGSR